LRSTATQGPAAERLCFNPLEWFFPDLAGNQRGSSLSRHTRHVKVFDGFDEISARLVFPYSNRLEHLAETTHPVHMTVLATGEVENKPKRVLLGGKWKAEDLEERSDKDLVLLLEKHDVKLDEGSPREKLLEELIGRVRDPTLRDKALVAFPTLQTMPPEAAAEHANTVPNSQFVWRREDGTFAVAHCWPVKYNAHFRKTFECSEENPDEKIFVPGAAAEFRESMRRTFTAEADKVPIIYATKTKRNPYLVLAGKRDALVDFLRSCPDVQAAMGICRVVEDGFYASIQVNGKVTPTAPKLFRLPADKDSVVYLKAGFEKMACAKPLDLFVEECTLGPQLDLGSNVYEKVLQTTAQYNEAPK